MGDVVSLAERRVDKQRRCARRGHHWADDAQGQRCASCGMVVLAPPSLTPDHLG